MVPGANGLWFRKLFSAMRSDLAVTRLRTALPLHWKKGGEEARKLKKFENLQHFSFLHCLWRLLLRYATAAFLPCCYFVKSAFEKCVSHLELSTQQSVAMSSKWRFCRKDPEELAPAILSKLIQ